MKLVVRCDDLGSFQAANRAIADATEQGLARNAGIMVPAPAFRQAVEMFRHRKDVCLGLHTTLTSEWENVRWKPILPREQVPSLVEPDGTFRRNAMAMFQHGVVFAQMLAEIEAQLHMARQAGLNIEYLDTHMAYSWVHTPENPKERFESVMMSFAAREGLAHFGHDYERGDCGRWIRGRLVPAVRLEHQYSDWVDRFCQALRAQVAAGVPEAILVVHPAQPDEEMAALYEGKNLPGQVAKDRAIDWQSLVHPQVLATCRELNIQPVKVTEL